MNVSFHSRKNTATEAASARIGRASLQAALVPKTPMIHSSPESYTYNNDATEDSLNTLSSSSNLVTLSPTLLDSSLTVSK